MLLVEGIMQDQDDRVRVAISHGLGIIGAQCIRTLLLALSDSSPSVVNAVAKTIISFGSSAIAEVLLDRGRDTCDAVSHEIKNILHGRQRFPSKLEQMLLVVLGKINSVHS